MRFSLNWIQSIVPVNEAPHALSHRLTMAGLPVDQMDVPAEIPDTVVVGRVVQWEKHPNADRLSVCRVDIGSDELLPIVCGAPNAREGIHVAVATVGSTLPNGLTIKKAKIRGEASRGMLCSAVELGLGEESDGILELEEARLGRPFAETLGPRDLSLEIDVPSNRGDCLSHRGLAREIAALTGGACRAPADNPPATGAPIGEGFTVTVEDPADCPRFTAHIIRNVTVGPSPAWLVERLEAVGQRSINNVVDVSNFIMLDLGQPTHAFDLDRLATDRIHVRRATAGETITTLDGVERKLTGETLLITDGKRPVAVAGVMGGRDTEVHQGTTQILLEAACFSPGRVLRGSRDLRLDTDASLRFRRGIDPVGVAVAARRAASLIAEVSGGEVSEGMVEVTDPAALVPRTVPLRPERVEALLGDPVPSPEISDRLASFGFGVETAASIWNVTVPSWRRDVLEECDLVEEVGRHRGYDHIGVRQYNASAVHAPIQPEESRRGQVRDVLSGFGFHEIITRTLTDSGSASRAGLDPSAAAQAFFPVLDPPSREEEGLRVSLVPQLLQVLSHNLRHGQPEVRVFEIGKTFRRREIDGGLALPEESEWVGVGASGGDFAPSLERSSRNFSFVEFKGVIEGLLSAFRIDALGWRSYTENGLWPKGAVALEADNRLLGFAWDVDAATRQRWDINRTVFLGGVLLDALPPITGSPIKFQEPSRFPGVRRDLALVVPVSWTQTQVREQIKKAAGQLLESLELFDHYRGEHIPKGSVGLGFSLSFRAPDRTLEEKEADDATDRVVRALKEHGIERREG